MSKYAIIEIGNKQFLVEENRFYFFESMRLKKENVLIFKKILVTNLNTVNAFGKPYLSSNYLVIAKVIKNVLSKKILVYKMKPKKKFRKRFGSRMKLTQVVITSIKIKNDFNKKNEIINVL